MENAVDRKQLISRLLAKAQKYRYFARWIGDGETSRRIKAMAEERGRRALALARPNEKRSRKRARKLWEENGRPLGRDVEFWLKAEREFYEAEQLVKETNE
jgi:Protein of unknown function (DUF2934)